MAESKIEKIERLYGKDEDCCEKKPVRECHQGVIVWKPEKRFVNVPYCPVCEEELHDIGKDYRPYYCSCGDWYWVEDIEGYAIYKN